MLIAYLKIHNYNLVHEVAVIAGMLRGLGFYVYHPMMDRPLTSYLSQIHYVGSWNIYKRLLLAYQRNLLNIVYLFYNFYQSLLVT